MAAAAWLPCASPQPDGCPEPCCSTQGSGRWAGTTLLSCPSACGRSSFPLAAAARCGRAAPCQRRGLDSPASGQHQLCPPQSRLGLGLGLGSPGQGAGVLLSMWQRLGPSVPGVCGCERRQGGLAGRWIAAPLQFCIPFLPDKPRQIFINQSATLFNKNLLTYK